MTKTGSRKPAAKKYLGLWVPLAWAHTIEADAHARGGTVSELIRDVLRQYIAARDQRPVRKGRE